MPRELRRAIRRSRRLYAPGKATARLAAASLRRCCGGRYRSRRQRSNYGGRRGPRRRAEPTAGRLLNQPASRHPPRINSVRTTILDQLCELLSPLPNCVTADNTIAATPASNTFFFSRQRSPPDEELAKRRIELGPCQRVGSYRKATGGLRRGRLWWRRRRRSTLRKIVVSASPGSGRGRDGKLACVTGRAKSVGSAARNSATNEAADADPWPASGPRARKTASGTRPTSGFGREMLHQHFAHALAFERHPAGEHFVEDHAQGVDVDFLAVAAVGDLRAPCNGRCRRFRSVRCGGCTEMNFDRP